MTDIESAKTHLSTHVTYPATKEAMIAACNNMSDFSDSDKQEFAAALPAGNYNSADEVIAALGW
jgi:hypothetical protein